MKTHASTLALLALLGAGSASAATPETAVPAIATTGTAGSPPATTPPTTTAPQPASPQPAASQPAASQPAVTQPAASKSDQADDAKRASAEQSDREAFFNAKLAALHAGLLLTADQEKLWPPIDQAIRGVASMQSSEREAMAQKRADRSAATNDDDDAADRTSSEAPFTYLRGTAERLLARGTAFKALADASEPLLTSLSDDQKHRLPILLDGLVPKHGPLGHVAALIRGTVDQDRETSQQSDDHDAQADDRQPGHHLFEDRPQRNQQRSTRTEDRDFYPSDRDEGSRHRRHRDYDRNWDERDGHAWHRQGWSEPSDRAYDD